MSIQLILARLQGPFGQEFPNQPVLLRPGISSASAFSVAALHPTNLVIGYNDSEESHVALDMGFCIARQMRLASRRSVMIHVVHVLEQSLPRNDMQVTQADLLLWRVRSLAKEWCGAVTTHLRFGDVVTELQRLLFE